MTRSIELTSKKKVNYNVVATWLCHVILLVIRSNNILLSPPIAFAYCFVPDNSTFWYTKPYSSIVENWFPILYCWKTYQPLFYFVGKCFLCHPTVVLISIYQYPIYWDATFFDSIPLEFGLPLIALQLRNDNAFIDLFSSQVGGLQCGKEASSIHTKL